MDLTPAERIARTPIASVVAQTPGINGVGTAGQMADRILAAIREQGLVIVDPEPVMGFAETLASAFIESLAGHLTCAEAEATASFYRGQGRPDTAEAILDSHAYADEPGDDHFKESRS